ncbi:sugar phosphate isomerase/epimerase [bacterium]|nr:sugar phosphate isomerase/epimerase [bacterium]
MEKLWSWAVRGSHFGGKTHEEIISICHYANIASVEANVGWVINRSEEEIVAIKDKYQKNALRLETFHLPNGLEGDICALYETIREKAVQIQSKMIYNASLLGCRAVILHPTTTSYNVDKEGVDRYISQMSKSMEVLLEIAEKENVVIAIENMLPGDDNNRFGSKPSHFKLFIERFSHPNCGFCLDTGHAHVSLGQEGPEKLFEVMSKRLVAVHLQDNAGYTDSHLAPGKGLINWKNIFQGMVKIKFKWAATIEAPPFYYGPNYTHSKESWKQLITDTDNLVKESFS